MKRKYPRTAEDREAIAVARRKLYHSQTTEEIMVVPDPIDDSAKTDVKTPDPVAHLNPIDPPGAPTAPAPTVTTPPAGPSPAAAPSAEVEIPDGFEKLGWKHLRALVSQISKTPAVNREQAVHLIAEEIQRRAKAAAKK